MEAEAGRTTRLSAAETRYVQNVPRELESLLRSVLNSLSTLVLSPSQGYFEDHLNVSLSIQTSSFSKITKKLGKTPSLILFTASITHDYVLASSIRI